MFKKTMRLGLVILAVLLVNACGAGSDYARTSAVHDGVRALGLVQMPDGTYEFRLCEMAETYTPEVLAEKCINPLLAADGLPLIFSEIPAQPGMLAAQIWNWGITIAAAAAVGLSFYAIGRHIVKIKAIDKLSREAYSEDLLQSLASSKQYEHFKLPERLKARLLTENEDAKLITFAKEMKLESGKTINLRELLENKKLQKYKKLQIPKTLKKGEVREISESLVELEESLKSGKAYRDTLVEGLDEMNDKGITLVDGVLGKIVREDGSGKFMLEDYITESLGKNSPIKDEYHEALQKLDKQVAEVLGKEEKSISSQQRNIVRLEAAAGLDEVLKVVEGVGDDAIVAAQKGDEKLLALTKNDLRDRVKELSELIEDGSKGADEVKEKLTSVRERVDAAVAAWKQQDEEVSSITDDNKVTKSMENFIKTTRREKLKDWNKKTKKAEKEAQKRFKKAAAFETGAKAYNDNARQAVHSDTVRGVNSEVEEMKDAPDNLKNTERGFLKETFTRLRNFKLKNSKIFTYWDDDASKLPSYTDANNKFAVRIANRKEVVDRLAKHEDVGEARVEKGVEKLVSHLAGVATFVAIPITSLRKKLSGHDQVSAAKRWDALTGSYELAAEGRVEDMHTIIEGIAKVTGSKVSDEVFYFMLRSGLRIKR